MKKQYLIALLAPIILFSVACNRQQCLDGDEYPLGSMRKLEPFTAINVNLSAVVEIVKDTAQNAPFVELVVEDNLEQHIATNIIDDTLNISLGFCFSQHADIVIRVHYDTLNTIITSGPGDIVSLEKMVQDELNIIIRSSGDVILTTDIENVYSTINGTGNISINGQVKNHTIFHYNSGAVNTYQAMTDDVIANHFGTGNIYVRAQNRIQANLASSGNLHYKGFPVIDTVLTGSGVIVSDN